MSKSKRKYKYKEPSNNLHSYRSGLTVEEAVAILGILGCQYDPIIFKQKEITPEELAERYPEEDSHSLRVGYWHGTELIRNGTLMAMTLRRMGRNPRSKGKGKNK